jgi:hypothetical protein
VSYEGDYRGGYKKRRVEKQRYFDEGRKYIVIHQK